jgi:hypothetical protein
MTLNTENCILARETVALVTWRYCILVHDNTDAGYLELIYPGHDNANAGYLEFLYPGP